MRSVSLLLLGLLVCGEASADYLVSDAGSIERYSDNGGYLGDYQVAWYDPEVPDVLLFTETYFTTVVYGLALGPAGAGQSVYSIGNGSFGFFELGGFDAATGLGGNQFVYYDPLNAGQDPSPALPQLGFDAVLQRSINVDPSGDLWGFGRIRYQAPDPYESLRDLFPDSSFPPPPVNYDVGWGVAKTPPIPGALPEVVFQLLPSGQDQLFRSFSNPLSIEFAPDGDAFVSTEYGLIEFDPDDVPTLLSSTIDGA